MRISAAIIASLACVSSAMALRHTVTVSDTGFKPAQLCIKPGAEVRWFFATAGHSIEETTTPGSCDSKNTWRSRVMNQGWRWSRKFGQPGVVSYKSGAGQDCANGFKGTIHIGGSCPTKDETPKDDHIVDEEVTLAVIPPVTPKITAEQ